jgi:hypothetical protein
MQAHPGVTLAALGALWAGWYLLACAFWPFARCLRCKGQGRAYQNSKRKSWRTCRWCKGSGQRRRVGRAVWAYFAQSRRAAR